MIPSKINSGHAAIELGISWQPSIAPQANPGSIKNKPAIYLIEPNSPRVRSMCLSVCLCVCHTEKRYSDLTVVTLAGKDTTQRPPQSKLKIPIWQPIKQWEWLFLNQKQEMSPFAQSYTSTKLIHTHATKMHIFIQILLRLEKKYWFLKWNNLVFIVIPWVRPASGNVFILMYPLKRLCNPPELG